MLHNFHQRSSSNLAAKSKAYLNQNSCFLGTRRNCWMLFPLAGIFLFLWLLCSLIKANQFVRKLATQPRPGSSSSNASSSSSGELIAGILYIASNAAVVGWLTSGQRLYQRFLLQPPEAPLSVSEVICMEDAQ
jgi:hypothetical protein